VKEVIIMKRRIWTTLLVSGMAALVLGTVTAATTRASSMEPLITIRHAVIGCHFLAYGDNGVTDTVYLVRRTGQSFVVENRDNCNHELVQTAGPRDITAVNVSGAEGTTLQSLRPGVRVTLSTPGLYRFTTVENDATINGASPDFYGSFATLPSSGPDRTLQIIVHVLPDRNPLPA
jgi:hypothetical protein